MAIDVYGGHTPNLASSTEAAALSLCAKVESIKKPIAVALFSGGHPDTILAIVTARDKLTKAGIPVYSGVESASRAINKIVNYYEYSRRYQ
jgi:acyl-CoA synthetase (NDP forming)